ncbi:MAG: hypothetical protein PHY59_06155 [Methanobacterium sp.]|nr:hypothetical protein [Methanobacterium sp.]
MTVKQTSEPFDKKATEYREIGDDYAAISTAAATLGLEALLAWDIPVASGAAAVCALYAILASDAYKTSDIYDCQARAIRGATSQGMQDLIVYQSGSSEESMVVEAFEGVPIIKQPSNWKAYNSLLTPRALYGNVLMGPGIQFLYGPHGYWGTDEFTIYASSNKNPSDIRKIHVTVNVKPIPVLNIPQGRM